MSDQDPHLARRQEMRLHRAERRKTVRRRRITALVVLAAVVLAFGLLLARIASGGATENSGVSAIVLPIRDDARRTLRPTPSRRGHRGCGLVHCTVGSAREDGVTT